MRRTFLIVAAVLAVAAIPASHSSATIRAPNDPPSSRSSSVVFLPTAAPEALPPESSLAPNTPWARRIGHLIGKRAFSVAVGADSTWMYRHDASVRRVPASNEKLLLSLALMDELGPNHEMPIKAAGEQAADSNGLLGGPLWIVGSGDPEVGAKDVRALARRVKAAGITKVRGRVLGAVRPFSHDWKAPGWKPYFPAVYVPLPTALSFEGNIVGGRHIDNPEARAAAALTKQLRGIGVAVTGKPGDGEPPAGLSEIAKVDSEPLEVVMRNMNVPSSNFRAETLGKLLGWSAKGAPGTIAKGAAQIEAFAKDAADVTLIANDSSGLSYKNRVAPQGMVELLWYAEDEPWENDLRLTLPKPGEGTLGSRLSGVTVRAKTGTLTNVSALSGWVWLKQTDRWAAFSIISKGTSKDAAVQIEDAIVRTLHERAS